MIFAIFITILFIIAFVIGASYFAYRMAFYPAPRLTDPDYKMPHGPQYDVFKDHITQSVQDMLSRPFKPVTITSHDGKKLYARYYHTADGAPLQIQFHGYKSSAPVDFSGGSKLAIKTGHNALVVDQRSHGRSEGSSITFGIEERYDVLSWVNYAISRFGDDTKIILAGLSMGAATVLMATDLDLPKNVVGVMADCPYSSPSEIIKTVCKRDMHLPPTLIYPFVKLGARIFGGFNIEESSAVTAVGKAKIPILIIHGEDDRFVPCSMSHAIHQNCTSLVTLETVPDAGHGLCYMVAPKRYEEVTSAFVAKILG